MGWLVCSALVGETGSFILAGSTSSLSIPTSAQKFLKIAGSSTYPAGNTDIGIITSTTLTTVSLYECGIIVAYTPGAAPAAPTFNFWQFFGF